MQVSIHQLQQDHGFDSCDKALEWAVANGYQLREYTDPEKQSAKEISADEAKGICVSSPDRVFIHANPLGLDNPE